jgi:hypothetical protein
MQSPGAEGTSFRPSFALVGLRQKATRSCELGAAPTWCRLRIMFILKDVIEQQEIMAKPDTVAAIVDAPRPG